MLYIDNMYQASSMYDAASRYAVAIGQALWLPTIYHVRCDASLGRSLELR